MHAELSEVLEHLRKQENIKFAVEFTVLPHALTAKLGPHSLSMHVVLARESRVVKEREEVRDWRKFLAFGHAL